MFIVCCLCCRMASVDQVAAIGRVLVDPGLDLTQRFRALFTLRNLGGKSSVNIYLTSTTKVFKHVLAHERSLQIP